MAERKQTQTELAKEWISKEIRIGNFVRGAGLPSEREMAGHIGVSYMTLRKAIGSLIEEGLLERNHGSGTYVCNEIPEQKAQKTLGLVLSAWSAPEILDMMMYFSEASEKAGWMLKVIYVRSWEDRSILDLWQNCDAFAMTVVEDLCKLPLVLTEKLRSSEKPVVVVGGSAKLIGRDSVLYKTDEKIEKPCDRLYQLGHRKILQVEQVFQQGHHHVLMDDFRMYLERTYPDIEYNNTLISVEVPSFQMPHHAIRQKFRECRDEISRYTAVICPLSFYLAVKAGLTDIGLRVPEDISVLTFGDRLEMDFYDPHPAVFFVSQRDMAFKTLELVRKRLEAPEDYAIMLQSAVRFIEGKTLGSARK